MNPHSMNSFVFSRINAEFFAPEYIKIEFKKYRAECLIKSRLSKQEFKTREKEIIESLRLIGLAEYKGSLKQSVEALPDPKDTTYLALALSIKAVIWSNDNHLKEQSLTPVFTTKELVELMNFM